jgi:hypothetical protein
MGQILIWGSLIPQLYDVELFFYLQNYYLFILSFKYSKWYICFNRLDELFAMVYFNLSFEIVLFYEKLNILQDKWKHQNAWNLLV